MREPVASSSTKTTSQSQKPRPAVVLLPPKPNAPLTPEQAEQAERRRQERKVIEERLAEREKNLAELFDKIGPSRQQSFGRVASRWIPADPKIKEVKIDLTMGSKVFYITPNEACRTSKSPNFWEVYLHRAVQYLLLIAGIDKKGELLQKVHTMTIEELVSWYQQLINIQSWNNNHQFLNAAIVGVGCLVEQKLFGSEDVA